MFLSLTKKSPYYQLTYERDGLRTTISTRSKNRIEAENFLASFNPDEIEIKEQKLIIKAIRLENFKEEYLKYINSTKSKKYIRSVLLSFSQLISFTGNLPLIRIDNRTLDKFVTFTYSRSKYATALYYRTLKAAFSKAVDWNYLENNPLKKVKLPKLPKNHPAFISYIEFQQILDNTNSLLLKDFFTIAYFSGLRLSELTNLKWAAIDLNTRIIKVQNSETFTTKNKKERIIPTNDRVHKILINCFPKIFSHNQYLFAKNSNEKLNEDYISKQFKKSVRKAGLPEAFHFHSCRHSFASNLVQKNVSLYVVKELLGHEDLKTTQIYSHLQNENLFQAVNLL